MQVNFSDELRGWLLHNIERGCAPATIIASMIEQRFDPEIAQALVQTFMLARAAGSEPPRASITVEATADTTPYLYETPRIAAGPLLRTTDRDIRIVARIAQPVVAVLENVLSSAECAELIELARDRLRPSTIVDPTTGATIAADYRDSHSMFFRPSETPFIDSIDRRFAEIMNCPLEHGEGLQVLYYGPGCKSAPHVDFLAATNPTNVESLARSGQRGSSLVAYLNAVDGGGETYFPEIGLAVFPRPGNAVYFEYANSLQQVDHKSLHASAAVTHGEKWAVTKWMRDRRYIHPA